MGLVPLICTWARSAAVLLWALALSLLYLRPPARGRVYVQGPYLHLTL